MHRTDCTNAADLQRKPERLVEVEWASQPGSVFLVAIQVEALDRTSLLSDVTRVLAENHVNILSASVNTTRDRVAMSRFVFEMGDPMYLSHVVNAVKRIDGVFDADTDADRDRLAEQADLVDMEGYAIALACEEMGVPLRMVKHISDNADETAHDWSAAVDGCARELGAWLADFVRLDRVR